MWGNTVSTNSYIFYLMISYNYDSVGTRTKYKKKKLNNDKLFKEELGWCLRDHQLVVNEKKKTTLWHNNVKHETDRNILHENGRDMQL